MTMDEAIERNGRTAAPKRADARRNEQAVLEAAAEVFVTSGVTAPLREIATRAGIGTATISRHFPTRSELIIAVYRHQVERCAHAAPSLLAEQPTAYAALRAWIDLFVDFLVTKHGLALVLQSDDPCFDPLHDYFLARLVPACGQLLHAAEEAGETRPGVQPRDLMRGIGNLCIGADRAAGHDPRPMVELLVAGLQA